MVTTGLALTIIALFVIGCTGSTGSSGADEFCELKWDFSDYQSEVGRENMSFVLWKEYYKANQGRDVLASPQVRASAVGIFESLTGDQFSKIADAVFAASLACQQEGFSNPGTGDS